jgi:hypothetical protein
MVIASIASFRTFRNMTLSNLGWDRLNSDRLEQLDKAFRQFALNSLLPAPPGGSSVKP